MSIALALLLPLLLPAPAGGQGAAKAPVDLLAVAPANALLVASTDRFDAIRERAAQNTWKRFFADERLGIGQLFDALLESQDAQHPWASAAEVLDTVHGRAVAFFAPVQGGKDFGGGALVQPEAGLDAFLGHYDRLLAWAATEESTVVSAKTYAGVDLDVIEHTGESPDAVVLFETEGVVGASVADTLDDALAIAHGMLDRIGGQDPSGGFASNAEFVAARGTGSAPAFDLHVQIQEMLEATGEGWDEADADQEMARKAGFDQVRWAHLSADVGTGEVLDLSLRVHLPRGTLAGDIADLLGPLPTELLKRMPGEGTSFLLADYDVAGLWKAIKAFMAKEDPEALKEMEADMAEGMSEVGLDFEEIVGALTGRFASFDMPVPAEEMPELAMYGAPGEVPESVQQGGAWFIGITDMALAGRVIEVFLQRSEMGPMVESETFLGTTVHSLDLGMVKPHWALLADGLAISMYPTPLRAFVRQGTAGAGPSAADVPRFADTARNFGGASVLTITDTATSVGTMLGMVQMLSFMAYELVEDPSQFTLLNDPPDPQMAAEFFHGTTIGGVRRDGDVLEIFAGAR